jgi:hypothetical protein
MPSCIDGLGISVCVHRLFYHRLRRHGDVPRNELGDGDELNTTRKRLLRWKWTRSSPVRDHGNRRYCWELIFEEDNDRFESGFWGLRNVDLSPGLQTRELFSTTLLTCKALLNLQELGSLNCSPYPFSDHPVSAAPRMPTTSAAVAEDSTLRIPVTLGFNVNITSLNIVHILAFSNWCRTCLSPQSATYWDCPWEV